MTVRPIVGEVHQLVVGTSPEDAITRMALRIQRQLANFGPSDVFALHLAPELSDIVRPLRDLSIGRRTDVLIYHASFGEPTVTSRLRDWAGRVVLIYHNITPAELMLDGAPELVTRLQWGRHELTLLRDKVVMAFADSAYNAADLARYGYDDVAVLPAGVAPRRLTEVPSAPTLQDQLRHRFPQGYVLGVSQVLPHKRFDTLVAAAHMWQRDLDRPPGLVVAGRCRNQAYLDALRELARRRGTDVWFTGNVPDEALATLFRGALAFVSTSAHEGLGVPPLEAMAFDVPVVALEGGAIGHTIADGGLVLPRADGAAMIAAAIGRLVTEPELRERLARAGASRLAEFETGSDDTPLVDAVARLLGY